MKSSRLTARHGLACLLIIGIGLFGMSPASGAWQQAEPSGAQDKQPAEKTEKKPERPPIYDESANAQEQIQTALAKAKKENRRVLMEWGGNWCGWCHHLHEIMKSNQEIARKIMYEYDVVLVDIGQIDKNQELVAKYEVDLKKDGVPFLTVLDSDGKVVINQETSSLENDDKENPGHNPEAVLEFLTKFQAEPLDARALLSEATDKASSEKKFVFLHFGAPWCGWCHRMEAWLVKPEIDSVMSKAFVDLKVDTDRMLHGEELFKEYCPNQGGIPWFVFIDPETKKVIATSDGPKGNVGFPFDDFEIEHYCDMLTKCDGKFTTEQIAAIKQSLNDNRAATKAASAEKCGRTRLTATVRYPSREVRDMVVGTGMARGAALSYDRLEDLLAKLQR